ncbi:hypothetical protein BSNK01_09470 [Bacillaceae bacterium]
MSEATMELKSVFNALQLTAAAQELDELLMEAETRQWSYRQCLQRVLSYELKKREEKQLARRFKRAAFPEFKTLDEFRIDEQPSLGQRQLKQLRELILARTTLQPALSGPARCRKNAFGNWAGD